MMTSEDNVADLESYRDAKEYRQFPIIPSLKTAIEDALSGPWDHPWEEKAARDRFKVKLFEELKNPGIIEDDEA